MKKLRHCHPMYMLWLGVCLSVCLSRTVIALNRPKHIGTDAILGVSYIVLYIREFGYLQQTLNFAGFVRFIPDIPYSVVNFVRPSQVYDSEHPPSFTTLRPRHRASRGPSTTAERVD